MNAFLLAQSLLKNSLYFYTALFTHPLIQIKHESDVLYVTSSIPDETYNNVWKTNFTKDTVEQRIVAIKKIFGKQSFIWWVDPSDTPSDLIELLEYYGGTFLEETSIMYRPQGMPLPEQDLIEVKKVTTPKMLNDFCVVKGGSPSAIDFNRQLLSKFIAPSPYAVLLYVGYKSDQPICCAVTVMLHDVGTIHSFVTDIQYQGKGYGNALLIALLKQLYANGCSQVLLDCSPEIVSFYQKQDFQEIKQYIKGYLFTSANVDSVV